MGRFAQESHTDLREWYVHCLDFRTLKRRLIDDPPDPYDDHPSMAGPAEAATAATSDGTDTVQGGPSSTVSPCGSGRGLLADPGRGGLGASSASGTEGNLSQERWRMQEGGGVGGGTPIVFPNPSSRVFMFEINQEHLLGSVSGSADGRGSTRIRGRKSAANLQSPPAEEAWVSPVPPAGGGGDSAGGWKTTGDPYVQACLKRSIVELYDTCHRLLSFKMLNYDAFVRLIELHCKREDEASAGPANASLSWSQLAGGGREGVGAGGGGGGSPLSREKSMKIWLLEQPLFASDDLSRTLSEAELLYASLFCNGDVDVARTALTFKASSSLRGNRRFDFGYRLGAASILLAWAIWDCIADDSLGKDVWHDPAFKIYRGLGNLVLLVYMWGVNIWVWRRFGIDYETCLSLDPKGPRVDPCEQVWNTGCNLSIAFLVSFICFYKALRGVLLNPTWVPIQFAHTFPLLLFFYVILCFVTPWSERKALMRVLWATIISPFGKVRFLEGYVGDILTSVVRVLIDVAFAFLYFLSGVRGWLGNSLDPTHDPITDHPLFQRLLVPLLMVAPLWWRFQQNLRRSYETRERWPHLGNALKYATAMSVSLFGTFQPQMHSSWPWVFCFVFATMYQFTWDVVMDWDLLRWHGRSLRLRPKLLYRNKNTYVAVAVVNLLLRFLWTVTLVPENAPSLFPKDFEIYLSPFIAAAEIVRRTMWGFLRVENEHLRIYGDSSSIGSDSDDAGENFQNNLSVTTIASSAASISSLSGSINGGASAPMMGGSRGLSGLDKLPYSRMEMPPTGLLRRATNPIKAWCLTKVKRESRCRLLIELCLFSLALVAIGLFAGLS
eukprot:jgi/Undpi1/7266/HiC_scaffold_22.g09739.m1